MARSAVLLLVLVLAAVVCSSDALQGRRGKSSMKDEHSAKTRDVNNGVATVTVGSATIVGVASPYNVSWYLGIPYATVVRFAKATPITLTGTINATDFGPSCAQTTGAGNIGAEDCLTMNVWQPLQATLDPTLKLPVVVWIYGGGFVEGESSNPLYNGASLVATNGNFIVVSFNYRLGVFGFYANENGCNWGLSDQQLALEWVRDNIGSFGGDPTRVTVFGQSAGGLSVCLHVCSSSSSDLFNAAIIDAGDCGSPLRTLDTQRNMSGILSSALGCTGSESQITACMNSMTTAQIMDANIQIGGAAIFGKYGGPLWQPVLDGTVITEQPITTMLTSSTPNKVPVLMGATTGSMTLFMNGTALLQPTSQLELNVLVDTIMSQSYQYAPEFYYSSQLDVISNFYKNVSNFNGFLDAAANFLSDNVFRCGTRMQAGLLSLTQQAYYWMWNHVPLCLSGKTDTVCTPVTPTWMGAFHGSDLGFWFNNEMMGSDDETLLQQQMNNLFVSFVMTHNPNPISALNGGVWATVQDPTNPQVMMLQTPIQLASEWNAQNCDMWDAAIVRPLLSIDGVSHDPKYSNAQIAATLVVVCFVVGIAAIIVGFAIKGRMLIKRGVMMQERTALTQSASHADRATGGL